MPDNRTSTTVASYGVDVKTTGMTASTSSDAANYQMTTLANQQTNLLINMQRDGELEGMITDVENGDGISAGVWGKLVNEVHNGQKGGVHHSDFYAPDGTNESLTRGGVASVYEDGQEVGPLLLLAPGDLDEMVRQNRLDPEEANALKILRGVYRATGSKAKAELALHNYLQMNDDDKKYCIEHMFSQNAVLVGEWAMLGKEGSNDDIKRARVTYPQPLSYDQGRDTVDMIYLLTELDPETYEMLGNAKTGVIAELAGDTCNAGETYTYKPFDRQTFVQNLEGGNLSDTETGQLEGIELRLSYGGELRSMNGTESQNFGDIFGKYVENNYGFASQYSGQSDSVLGTKLMSDLSITEPTQAQIVQLQKLVDATSLTPAQKEKVFSYFVSNGVESDTSGDGEIELNQALSAFLNDPAVDGVAEDWMTDTFALAKVQSGDTQSAWALRAEAGAASPPTGCAAAQTIEARADIGDPMVPPSDDPAARNTSLITYHMLSDPANAPADELTAVSNLRIYGTWDAPAPEDHTIPDAAKIQMTADNLTEEQQKTVAQIYNIVSGASNIPENQKSALFSYILTGRQEPAEDPNSPLANTPHPAGINLELEQAILVLKQDPSVTPENATLIDTTIDGTPIYQPDQLSDSNVTDKVWNAFADNREGFDDNPYTQVTVTQENAKAALGHMDGLGLASEELGGLIDRMVKGEMTESDIYLLNTHKDDTTLQPGDRDVILSAIDASGGVVPIPNDADKGFKDSAIDTAFDHLNFGGTKYTQEDIALLKKAAKDGTMTPDQVALLMVNTDQVTLGVDDKVALLSACDYSHRTAKAANGAVWETEVQDNVDHNGDNVIGDPYENAMTPEACAESGMGYDQITNLGALFFEVMIGRMEALDSTVRQFGEMVKKKNMAISNMNTALECVPPQPASSSDGVDVSKLSFKYEYLDPDTGTKMTKTMNLKDYLDQQGIKLPSADGSTTLDATQLSSLRQSMSNRATAWGSDSALASAQFQDAMSKYNTCVSQLSSFLPKWYDMCTKAFTGR